MSDSASPADETAEQAAQAPDATTDQTGERPAAPRPSWAPFTLLAFVALVVCTNIAGIWWARLLETNPELLIALSARNRYLALALGADVSIPAYWVIATARLMLAFAVCHLVGRAFGDLVLQWFVRYLGIAPDSIAQFSRAYLKAEWVIVPFFAGSNIVAALSGIHRTPPARLAVLLLAGIAARLALIWWLAEVFEQQLETVLDFVQRYQWWAVGISIAVVVASNAINLRRGSAR